MATATEYRAEADSTARASTLTDLASGIMTDVQTLMKQQMSLFRAEFSEDLRRTKRVAQCFAIGIFLFAFSAVLLIIAAVHLLQEVTHWPPSAAWGAVGGAALLVGAVSVVVGARILKSYNPLPDKAFHALQENVSCLTSPQK